jgi:FeS assembly SUF system protein
VIEFTENAKNKVKEFIQNNGGNAALRIIVRSKSEKGFVYDFQLEEYNAERPSDIVVREGGFSTRIDPESAKSMRGAKIDWIDQSGLVGFSVKNPNLPIPPVHHEGGLKGEIIETLRTIFDPEIPVNIYDLGLIYGIDIDDSKNVTVRMTLTAPNCPAAEQLPVEVETKTRGVSGVKEVLVKLVWEPAWTKEMMSDAAKLQLGL